MAEKTQERDAGVASRGGGRGGRKASVSTGEGVEKKGRARADGDSPGPRDKAGAGEGAIAEPAKTGRGAAGKSSGGRAKKPNLKADLREFASARPQGWGHEDWISFLESLQSRGHNVQDRDAIGLALEKERLDLALSGIKGITGPKRKALIERFGTTWTLRNASVDDIASAAGIDRTQAERLKSELN
jgi:hypothetical protein